MKILMDVAGHDLAYAMSLLFEKRLGHEIYIMAGMEWFDHGYWWMASEYPINHQFLAGHNATGLCTRHDWHFRMLTYKDFLEGDKDFDILLSLVGVNEKSFRRLKQDHIPNAKLVRFIGNPYEWVNPDSAENLMLSIPHDDINIQGFSRDGVGRNVVTVVQEFDIENEYLYKPVEHHNIVSAFQMHDLAPYEPFGKVFLEYKNRMPDFVYRRTRTDEFPGYSDGVTGGKQIAETSFFWETKGGSGSGGNNFYHAFACGRPLITFKSNYFPPATEMLRDGETCIDLGARDIAGNVNFIRECASPERLEAMCQASYDTFKQYVNYEEIGDRVKTFLENLR